jgi:hypothetical protein
MGKVGEKQKRRPKIKDKRQSERFRQAARELGVDRITDTFDGVLEELVTPKYELYTHKIYNATHLIKGIDTPFPTDLVESEWRLTFKVPKAFKAAENELRTKGHHIFQSDMSAEYGAENAPSDTKN